MKVCESLFCLKLSVTVTSKEIMFSQIAHFELIRNSPFISGSLVSHIWVQLFKNISLQFLISQFLGGGDTLYCSFYKDLI